MSRELERAVAKECGVSHQIFTQRDCDARKGIYGKSVNHVGMKMRKELLARGWEPATEHQVVKALRLDTFEFRCTAVTCGCVGQKVIVTKRQHLFYDTQQIYSHNGNSQFLFETINMIYQRGVGNGLLMSPKTRKQLGI